MGKVCVIHCDSTDPLELHGEPGKQLSPILLRSFSRTYGTCVIIYTDNVLVRTRCKTFMRAEWLDLGEMELSGRALATG
jgi:hypothetical protein